MLIFQLLTSTIIIYQVFFPSIFSLEVFFADVPTGYMSLVYIYSIYSIHSTHSYIYILSFYRVNTQFVF